MGVEEFPVFETWVNGTKHEIENSISEIRISGVSPRRGLAEILEDVKREAPGLVIGLTETRWLTKIVKFEKGERVTTRVKYQAPYGAFHEAVYLYGTGRTWKGKIKEARFVVRCSPTVWAHRVRFPSGYDRHILRKYTFHRLSEYEFEYALTDFEPEEKEEFCVVTAAEGLPKDQPWEANGVFYFENKPLPEDILQTLSFGQLTLLRNAYYAVHGKRFESPDLDEFFRKRDWYKPKEDFKEADLTETQQENVKRVLEYEKQLKEFLEK